MADEGPLAVQRGDYGRNYLATSLFVVGRLASGPLQYALIRSHPLSYFGLSSPPTGGAIHLLGYHFPRLPLLTALMPTVLGVKHTIWQTIYCRERLTTQFAFFAILADGVYETVSSLAFDGASANPFFSKQFFYAGTALYFSGMAIELVAELQRAAFKSKPENKGKLCTTGLWALTRHINYTANVVFGFGYGLATGGPIYSMATAGMYLSNFISNAMPSIEAYCSRKYGQQWTQYKRATPWQLIPGLY